MKSSRGMVKFIDWEVEIPQPGSGFITTPEWFVPFDLMSDQPMFWCASNPKKKITWLFMVFPKQVFGEAVQIRKGMGENALSIARRFYQLYSGEVQ